MRNGLLFPKLALQNIKKNGKFYIPYILTCICTVAGFYIMCAISNNDGLRDMPGYTALTTIMYLGCGIIGIFSFIFLFYTNSFLMKRRKKELGLYNILGMEKKHIAKILFCETLFIGVIGIVLGIGFGILFDKLLTMLLCNLLSYEVPIQFSVSYTGMIASVILFGAVFILNLIFNLLKIHLSKPIELLQSGSTGEKEPKTKWILTILGIVCLGIGYYISVTTEHPLEALSWFFAAVLLVVIGTYCLFIACSIALLKLLRKNKKFYYKTKHFISVSGMLYRMKQNAVGLANICILSTMVLVMVSTTVSLYAGIEDAMRAQYPADIEYEAFYTETELDTDAIYKNIYETAEEQHREVANLRCYDYLSFAVGRNENTLSTDNNNYYGFEATVLCFITADTYKTITGEDAVLSPDETLVYTREQPLSSPFTLMGKTYKIKEQLKEFPQFSNFSAMLMPVQYIVVADSGILNNIYKDEEAAYGERANSKCCEIYFDINGTAEETRQFMNALSEKETPGNYESLTLNCRQENEDEVYSLYGGFLFLGLFLGVLFMMATVLIIYYKQISEGYEDKERYEIMQKVGLSRHEVKSSINSQILMVFFLPILVAVIHVAFCFKLMTRLLSLMYLTNVWLFFITTVITVLAFILIYSLVFYLTSKVYYKIVKH